MKYLLACFAFVALGTALGQAHDGKGPYRITNGTEAAPHKYPWMARLMKQTDGDWTHGCGGSLINHGWHVVTAAHCVDDKNPDELKVVLGDHCEDTIEDGETTMYIMEIIVHEKWDTRSKRNDIALLKLSNRARSTKNIQPIVLNSQSLYEGDELTVAGWGDTKGTTQENCLNEATSSLIPCHEDDKWPGLGDRICTSCAGSGEKRRIGPCHGDSGGPLMKLWDDGSNFHLAGIVSGGVGGNGTCDNPDAPARYTNVKNYRDWIWDNI